VPGHDFLAAAFAGFGKRAGVPVIANRFAGAFLARARRAIVFGAACAGFFVVDVGQALASTGCTAVNGGSWIFSDTSGDAGQIRTDNFAAGDQLAFSFSGVGTYGFSGSLSPGGSGSGAASASFTVTASGSGSLSLFAISGTYSVTSASCIPAGSSSTTNSTTTNSQYVRALQLALTKAVATVSGQVISGAVDAAIGDAFATTGSAPIIVGPNGLFFNFAADPQRDAAAAKAIDALAYSGDGIPKGPLFTPRVAPDWNAWADLRGTGFDLPSSDETGHQVNLTLGVSRKLGEDLLVGFFTGYETIDYTVASLNAQMSGNGGTIGSYAAWRFMPHWRLDGMAGWSDIFYNASAGTASGDFTGSRWLGSAGLTGTYVLSGVNFEPSTHIYSLYESENAWTDSLGTLQAARDFSESRVSAGGKISTPWQVSDIKLSPYAGFYGDYRFSSDNALPVAASVVGISDGWSGRATGGVTFISRNGASLSLGGEYGGIGAGYEIWSGNVRVNVPF
jgi:hypothetical protein